MCAIFGLIDYNHTLNANNDGVLNALDAAAILKEIVGIGKRENAQMVDFNSDGVINALDASAILRQMLLK